MPTPALKLSGSTVVLVGSFNPPIFQPEWFVRQNLLPENEAKNADIKVIHSEVTQFETERFAFQVTTDRLIVGSKPNTVSEHLKDLVRGTFYVLEHTPVQMMGLNRQMHFEMNTEEAWHRLGDKLAPKDIWNSVIQGRRPGLRNLEVLYQKKADDPREMPQVTVLVQPSLRVLPYGAYFEVNNHFAASPEHGLADLMDLLDTQWEELQKDAERIAREVLAWAAD